MNCKELASANQFRNNSNFVLSDHMISSLNRSQWIYDPFNCLTYFHLIKKDRWKSVSVWVGPHLFSSADIGVFLQEFCRMLIRLSRSWWHVRGSPSPFLKAVRHTKLGKGFAIWTVVNNRSLESCFCNFRYLKLGQFCFK